MALGTAHSHHGHYAYAIVDAADVRNLGNGTYEIRITGIVTGTEATVDPLHPPEGTGIQEERKEFDTFGLLCPRCRHIISLITGWIVLLHRGAVETKRDGPPCV